MKIGDVTDSLLSTVKERVSSPYTGAVLLSWMAWNYQLVLVLLSSKSVEEKILIIDWLLYEDGLDKAIHLLIGPMLTAYVIVGIYPAFSLFGYKLWSLWHIAIRAIQQKVDAGKLISKEEFLRIEKEAADELTRLRRSIDMKDVTISDLRAERDGLNALVEKLREAANEPTYDPATGAVHSGEEELGHSILNQQLIDRLLGNQFVLSFNKKLGDNGRKRMLFGPDGMILEGANDNEASWRVSNGLLEFLNSDGGLYNQFYWHPGAGEFVAVNKSDLPALPGQRLYS